MRWSLFDAESDYHGLRMGLTKRLSRGLQLQSGEKLTVALEMRNLLGARYAQPGALGVDIPNVGRRIFVRATLGF